MELWGRVNNGVEIWGGVMGQSFDHTDVKLTVMAYLRNGNPGTPHCTDSQLQFTSRMAVLQDLALCEVLSEVSQTTLSF